MTRYDRCPDSGPTTEPSTNHPVCTLWEAPQRAYTPRIRLAACKHDIPAWQASDASACAIQPAQPEGPSPKILFKKDAQKNTG